MKTQFSICLLYEENHPLIIVINFSMYAKCALYLYKYLQNNVQTIEYTSTESK